MKRFITVLILVVLCAFFVNPGFVTYYVPCSDVNSEAYGLQGQYQTITGICWKVDPEVFRTIQVDRKTISFEDILRIENASGIFSKSWEYPDG